LIDEEFNGDGRKNAQIKTKIAGFFKCVFVRVRCAIPSHSHRNLSRSKDSWSCQFGRSSKQPSRSVAFIFLIIFFIIIFIIAEKEQLASSLLSSWPMDTNDYSSDCWHRSGRDCPIKARKI
jgi:hypothetical protein